eukprot:TRINITY_DN7106_c0_g1_i1.p1 TRINITY_DN7106_c0_g1~~TRINITY_DN7106_c0_g1_i1.p1  ORF type:complete len:290 (-),score=42.93 TRINITY_DN7106_c0_g1_i1:255-1124(-)
MLKFKESSKEQSPKFKFTILKTLYENEDDDKRVLLVEDQNKVQKVLKIAPKTRKSRNEKKFLLSLTHKQIVDVESYFGIKLRGKKYDCLLQKFYNKTDLINIIELDLLLKQEKLILEIFYQMCVGVNYLHNEGIVHLDIKPDNFLVTSDNDELTVAICDFECAVSVKNKKKRHVCKTFLYRSPECVQISNSSTDPYAVDVWSLGVSFFLMLTSCFPFRYNDNVEEIIKIGNLDLQTKLKQLNYSDSIIDLLYCMLEPVPANRYTTAQILDHEIFNKILSGTPSSSSLSM